MKKIILLFAGLALLITMVGCKTSVEKQEESYTKKGIQGLLKDAETNDRRIDQKLESITYNHKGDEVTGIATIKATAKENFSTVHKGDSTLTKQPYTATFIVDRGELIYGSVGWK
ncbi:MAG: hypothetical protein ACYDFU_04185 [Nitrospirota bacterium]